MVRTGKRNIQQRAALVGAALAIVLLAGACGGSSSSKSSPTVPSPGSSTASTTPGLGSQPTGNGTHEFKATLTTTGAVKQTEDFTEPLSVLPPCATLAKDGAGGGGDPTWSMPVGGSQTFALNANISPYTGPGTYTDQKLLQGSFSITAGGAQYSPVASSTFSVTVKADGSGSMTFTGIQDPYTPTNVLAGSETWTCS